MTTKKQPQTRRNKDKLEAKTDKTLRLMIAIIVLTYVTCVAAYVNLIITILN